MGTFEDFVNREVPRRSPTLTIELTGYDDDPNDAAAPSIIQSAPKGTWYLRETPKYIWYRKNPDGVWEVNQNGLVDTTIYVDSVSGDDTNPGTSASPIQSHQRATELVGIAGWGVVVQYAAGDYPIEANDPTNFYENAYAGHVDTPVDYRGSMLVEDTFTIDAVNADGLQITKTGAGWTANEHRGKFIDIGSPYFKYIIKSNDVDTLEVIYDTSAYGGYRPLLAVGESVDLVSHQSFFVFGDTYRLRTIGRSRYVDMGFKGMWLESTQAEVNYGTCKFIDETRVMGGRFSSQNFAYCYFENGAYGTCLETNGGWIGLNGSMVFYDSTIAIDVWDGLLTIGQSTLAFDSIGQCIRVRDNGRSLDYCRSYILENCGQLYYMLFDNAKVHKRDHLRFVPPMSGGAEVSYLVYMTGTARSQFLTNAASVVGNGGSIADIRTNDDTRFSFSDLETVYSSVFRDPADNTITRQVPTKYVQPYEADFLQKVNQAFPPFIEGRTILVETTGDDTADGFNNPIATIGEAVKRIPQAGSNIVLQFGAGSFEMPDNGYVVDDEYGKTDFSAPRGTTFLIKGATSVVDTFTILSTDSEYTITKDSSTPDWTPDALVGKIFDRGGGEGFHYCIVENTATTITVATRIPNEVPTSGTYDIFQNDTIFTKPPDYENSFNNAININSGNVNVRNIEIDGGGLLRFGFYVDAAARAQFNNVTVKNLSSMGACINCRGIVNTYGCWFENSKYGIVHTGSSGYAYDYISVYKTLTSGVKVEYGNYYCGYGASVFAYDVATLYELRYSCYFIQSKYHYFKNVNTFCSLADTDVKYDGHTGDLIAMNHAGGGPLSTVNNYVFYSATQGQHDILLANSASITLDSAVPSTWASINGVTFSLSDLINVYDNNYIDSSLTRLHSVSGYTAAALGGLISQEPTGTTATLELGDASNQTIDLESATGNVTVTLNGASKAVGTYFVKVIQGSTPREIDFDGIPFPVPSDPGLDPTEDSVTIFEFYFDGTTLYGVNKTRSDRLDAKTILIETTGDDTADGFINPIATIKEAIKRIPQAGTDLLIQFGAGSFQLPDNDAVVSFGPTKTVFEAPVGCRLDIYGTTSVSVSFTILSSDGEYTVTKDASTPDWTPGEHVGKLFDRQSSNGLNYFITENTATTLTVNTRSFNEMPTSGTYDIIEHDTIFTAPPDHGTTSHNSVHLGSGDVRLRSITVDGENTLRSGIIVANNCNSSIQNVKVKNLTGAGIISQGQGTFFANWFESVQSGIFAQGIYVTDIVSSFIGCTSYGVNIQYGTYYCGHGATVYAKDTPTLYNLRYGAQFIQSKYFYLDNVGTFCALLDTDVKFDGHANDLLAVNHAGGGPLSNVTNYVFYSTTQGQHDILLANSANITLDSAVPSTWASINGVTFSLSDLINVYSNNYIDSSLTRMNSVAGYTAVALQGTISQEPTGTTVTLELGDAPNQVVDLESATGDVTATINGASMSVGTYRLKVIQGSTTRNLILTGVIWTGGSAPTITATNDKVDLFDLHFDGVNLYGEVIGQNY